MNFGAAALLTAVNFFVFYTPFAEARLQCLDLFAQEKPKTVKVLDSDMQILANLQRARLLIDNAQTTAELSSAIHNLTIAGNYAIDSIVDNIFLLKYQNPPPEVQHAVRQSTDTVFTHLAQMMGVPSRALQTAVLKRIQIEEQFLREQYERQQSRSLSVGFQFYTPSSDSTPIQAPQRNRIGFYPGDIQAAGNDTPTLPEPSFTDRARLSAANTPTGPIGFRPSRSVPAPRIKEPVGYIRFQTDDTAQAALLPSIMLSLDSGLFEFITNRPRIGF